MPFWPKSYDRGPAPPEIRRGELLLGLALALGSFIFSNLVVASKLFLIYLYGWSRVWHEHLRILRMPKGRPWPVSNGDFINQGFFIHFLIAMACWFALFIPTYLLLWRLLPLRKTSY